MNVERISQVAHFLAEPKRLQLLAEIERQPLSLEALEERLDIEPAKVKRLLQQLQWFGFVERTPTGGAWRPASPEVRSLVRALVGLDAVECSRSADVVPLLRGGALALHDAGRRQASPSRGVVRRHGARP